MVPTNPLRSAVSQSSIISPRRELLERGGIPGHHVIHRTEGTLDTAMSALPETPGATPAPAYPVLRHRLAPPPADPPLGSAADLREFVGRHPRLLVLTGAGCSTDSGIPDYRDATGAWKRQDPVEFAPFMRDPLVRARYWARSLIGWRSFGTAAPNAAHHALAALERAGRVCLLVTQNVDGLHQAAGSQRVLDLHGRLDTVACTTCRQSLAREDWQRLLEEPTRLGSGSTLPSPRTAMLTWSGPTSRTSMCPPARPATVW